MKSRTIERRHRWLYRGMVTTFGMCMTAGLFFAGKTPLHVQAEEKQDKTTITAPGKDAEAEFWLDEDGTFLYDVFYKNQEVVEDSELGFVLTKNGNTTQYRDGFSVLGVEESETVDTSWENPFGDRKEVPEHYNKKRILLQAEDGTRVDVICRAYDEGVAFRYSFPKDEETGTFEITQELTHFNLDDEATAYVHIGRNQTEVQKTPVTELTKTDAGYFRPLTVIGDNYAMTITEANQVDYARVHFTVEDGSEPGTLCTMFNGHSDNVDLVPEHVSDVVTADVSEQAFETSWRTFVLGDNEGQLTERHYLVQNLNPPCALEDTSWITPGQSLRSSLTTAKAKMAIDFAVKHNIEYVHFDAGWYGPEGKMESDPWKCIDGFDLDEISAYADENNIKLMVYINYRHLEDQYNKGQLDAMFKMYVEKWGIDGIKFGFVPVGSQASTKMVYEWVKIAAQNKLIVDIHDEMLTTGYDRTYPNLLTYEAIHGDEENPTPKDDLGYLFTRMVAGQADHTWCFNRGDRNTTKAFRIAGSMVYYSPLVFPYWYDDGALASINNPASGMWDDMPTTWDESHMLEAKIEEYATVARRSGKKWYLASISAADHELSVPLTMLESNQKYKAEIYTNDPSDQAKVLIDTYCVDADDVLRCAMNSNSGYAVRITPVSEEEAAGLKDYEEQMKASVTLSEKIETLPEVTVKNLPEVKAQAETIRAAYDQLGAMGKNAVSNRKKLEDIEAEIYRLENCPVKMISVNGKELEDFTPEKTEYEITLLGGASIPYVTCEAYSESQITELKQPSDIPGTASITVKNAFTEKTYQIHFTVPTEAAVIYASDYTDYTADGRKEFKKDTDRSGGTLKLYNENGETETFEKGIGTHASTNLYFNVKGKGVSRFQAVCGVSANNGKENNKVGFKVYKNSRTSENLLFDSGAMTQKTPYKTIDVDVTGAETIILEANDGGDGIANDHANWCDAKFVLGEVFTTPIDEMIQKAQDLTAQLTDENAKSRLQKAIAEAEQAKTQDQLTYQMVYQAAVVLRDVILDEKMTAAGDVKVLLQKVQKALEKDYSEENYQKMIQMAQELMVLSQNVDTNLDEMKEKAEAVRALLETAPTDAEKAAAAAKAAKEAAEAAQTAKEAAEEAKTAAEDSKAKAETAQKTAEKAVSDAQAAKEAAEKAKADAEKAKADAEEAKNSTTVDKDAANAAAERAASAQTAAKEAQEKAEAAESAAESAKAAAEKANTEAGNAEENAKAAQTKAENAASEAENAKKAAETAKTDAVAAKEKAEEAKNAAEMASQDAVAAKNDAVTAKEAAANAAEDAKEAQKQAEVEKEAAKVQADLAKAYAKSAEAAAEKALASEKAAKEAAAKAEETWKKAEELLQKTQKEAEEKLAAMEKLLETERFQNQKIKVKKLKAGKGKLQIGWEKAENADGYVIEYATKANFKNKKQITVKKADKTGQKITKLKKNKKYVVRIRAYKEVDGKRIYTNYSSKKKVTIR